MKRGLNGIIVFALALLFMNGLLCPVSAKTSSVTETEVKVGTGISVYRKGASYKSSNPKVAYVGSKGHVSAKKIGSAVITITTKKGKKIKQKVNVVANGKITKDIAVCSDEIKVVKDECKIVSDPKANPNLVNSKIFTSKLTVKNTSKKKIKKLKIVGTVDKQSVVYEFGSIGAGKTKTATAKGTTSLSQAKTSITQWWVYSKEMLSVYDVENDTYDYEYATPDKTPPTITGFVKKNSYNGSEPYMVVYSNQKKTYNFTKYVTATDDRDDSVTLECNTDKVNFKKAGIYKVTYTATDKAGNTAKATAKIEVRIANDVDKMADKILKKITNDSMTDVEKAVAIYDYTRNHISYTGYSDKSDWEAEAIRGVRNGVGDCFTYYSVARALLTRAGLPNITLTRYRGEGHHWWSMVYVEGGFYHFDCGPRHWGGRFCLLTDAQLTQYSKEHENVYIWDYAHTPKSPTKKLFDVY